MIFGGRGAGGLVSVKNMIVLCVSSGELACRLQGNTGWLMSPSASGGPYLSKK